MTQIKRGRSKKDIKKLFPAGSKLIVPKTIEQAIDELQQFFECDMWYSSRNEWLTEEDMEKYLNEHFNILRFEIKAIKNRTEKVKKKTKKKK